MKYPAIMLYTGDWLKDPHLGKCRPATRGIWMDAIALMHEDDRSGILTGTPAQLATVCRCTPRELLSAANDLKATKTANVTIGNGVVTLINRRMRREWKARQQGRIRTARCRNKESVTPEQPPGNNSPSYSSSISVTKGEEIPPALRISREKELTRVDNALEKLRDRKDQWADKDRDQLKKLKDRRTYLLAQLGAIV